MRCQPNLVRFHLLVGIGVLATFLSSGGARTVAAKDRFPYRVYAAAEETPVSSGPGEGFYATDLLPEGTPLEVHRREPGGWLAIRPPERSFSWVPARKLHVAAGDRLATVVADDAVAWIGSRVETVQDHRWQVRLERGERVIVLGHRDLADDQKGTTETWYQIAPPSGEFRWVHADDVTRRPVPPEVAAASSEAGPATAEVNADPGAPRALDAAAADANVRRAELTTARSRQSAPVEPAQYRAEWSPRSTPRQARRIEPATDAYAPLPASSPATDRELEDITLQMTILAQREPNLWNLAPLRARTEALIDRGANSLERGKARLMLEKIEEFEELQQRHIRTERGVAADAVADAGSTSPIGAGLAALNFVSAGNPSPSSAASASAAAPRTSPSIEPRFDGTGWLLPVHSTKRVAPPYALLDDNGQVIQYVTPSPGLNLHRYERKRVGIYGQKGASQLLNAPHLTAHRVVDLDRHAKRQ